jgi:hypothetical protein
MSRIDEALRKIAGGTAAEPKSPSSFLKRFAVEKAPKADEDRVSQFAGGGTYFPEEARPAAVPKPAARSVTNPGASAPFMAPVPVSTLPPSAIAPSTVPPKTLTE